MRIAVFGTGGAGGYFGALLARAGNDIRFIARGPHLQAIRMSGLTLETPEGEVIVENAAASDDPSTVGPVDLVLVGVKAWQVAAAAEQMRPLVGPETIVLPLQNGVEASSELASVLGRSHVLVGLCSTFSWVVAPGRIRNFGASNFIRFGEFNNIQSDRTKLLLKVFCEAGVNAEVPSDIHRALWMKFIAVTSFGGVGALSRAPIGVMRQTPETRELLMRCVNETATLAKASSIDLAATALADTMTFLDGLAPDGTTSLQRDIADGKPSELGYWSGAVVRLGKIKEVDVRTHQVIYNALLPLEHKARGLTAF